MEPAAPSQGAPSSASFGGGVGVVRFEGLGFRVSGFRVWGLGFWGVGFSAV